MSRDHLDYHTTVEDYLVSKCALFDRVLPSGQVVVVNIDDPYGHLIKLISENRKHKVITVGVHEAADIKRCRQTAPCSAKRIWCCTEQRENFSNDTGNCCTNAK